MAATPTSAAISSQAAAAAIIGPEPGPAYIRPELISGGNAPNSSTYPPQSAEPAGDFGWHMGISGGGNHGSVNDPTGRSLPRRESNSGPSARDSAGRAGRRMLTKRLRPER
ncbi:hypothetical protein MTIM_19320 [Mycobacterium timonense]|uniref:Uncharacterized protein n=1 Tax=Mycobacterium timonense TaxID=701043 RepID=A0A7I9Z566_9MYCO|nr:hypothetical protein MTIM_19320 [Mycobacterium timonense]